MKKLLLGLTASLVLSIAALTASAQVKDSTSKDTNKMDTPKIDITPPSDIMPISPTIIDTSARVVPTKVDSVKTDKMPKDNSNHHLQTPIDSNKWKDPMKKNSK